MLRSRIIKWSVDASKNLDNVLKTGSMFFSKIVFIYIKSDLGIYF